MHSHMDLVPREESSREIAQVARQLDYVHGLVAGPVSQRMASVMRGGELTFSQVNALYSLYAHGPQSITALADAAGLTHAAASRMVDKMVRGSLVVREEWAQDRRQKRVQLTQTGLQQLRGMQDYTIDLYAKLLEQVPRARVRLLSEALDQLEPYLPTHPMEPPSPRQSCGATKVAEAKTG